LAAYVDVILNSGDKVTLLLDMQVKQITAKDFGAKDINMAAFTYGPMVLAKDGRLCKNLEDAVETEFTAERIKAVDFDTNVVFKIKEQNNEFILIDYASAGKSWNYDSKLSVWFPKSN